MEWACSCLLCLGAPPPIWCSLSVLLHNRISNLLAHSKACYKPLIGSCDICVRQKVCGFYHPFWMYKSRWDWYYYIIVLTSNVILCHTSEMQESLSQREKLLFLFFFFIFLYFFYILNFTAFFLHFESMNVYSEGNCTGKW